MLVNSQTQAPQVTLPGVVLVPKTIVLATFWAIVFSPKDYDEKVIVLVLKDYKIYSKKKKKKSVILENMLQLNLENTVIEILISWWLDCNLCVLHSTCASKTVYKNINIQILCFIFNTVLYYFQYYIITVTCTITA